MHIREHGAENMRDDILHACLHNLAYDPQCEDSPINWLLELISLTDDPEFYHQRILSPCRIRQISGTLTNLLN